MMTTGFQVFWLEENLPQHMLTSSIHQIYYCSLTNVWKHRVGRQNIPNLESISYIKQIWKIILKRKQA